MYEDRIQWTTYKGVRLLMLSYTNAMPDQLPGIIAKVVETVSKEPLGSTRYLIDVTGLHFNTSVLGMFNKMSNDTKPYDKCVAILGVTGLVKVMYDAFSKIAKVPTRTFNTKEEALEWLIKQ